jgi:hypothetical protein
MKSILSQTLYPIGYKTIGINNNYTRYGMINSTIYSNAVVRGIVSVVDVE